MCCIRDHCVAQETILYCTRDQYATQETTVPHRRPLCLTVFATTVPAVRRHCFEVCVVHSWVSSFERKSLLKEEFVSS